MSGDDLNELRKNLRSTRKGPTKNEDGSGSGAGSGSGDQDEKDKSKKSQQDLETKRELEKLHKKIKELESDFKRQENENIQKAKYETDVKEKRKLFAEIWDRSQLDEQIQRIGPKSGT
ncbi:hypothetical protein FG386_000054 [Cryptosporidium ryanae]|uniref:uncharacterized protein n=1 Tax=Cryptosporidium ryanae TaxID=515981 RepID=UPI00351A3840|nr:hypothetical protein FG386_000054 [Cryptosporidium ryanae]